MCSKTHPGPKITPKTPQEGQNWPQCTSCGPINWFWAKKNKFESVRSKVCSFHSESASSRMSLGLRGCGRRPPIPICTPAPTGARPARSRRAQLPNERALAPTKEPAAQEGREVGTGFSPGLLLLLLLLVKHSQHFLFSSSSSDICF